MGSGQSLRHKAKLHEGTQPQLQKEVKDFVHKGKAVDSFAVGVLGVDVHVLRKNAVEFDRAKADVLLHPAEQCLHVVKQQRRGAADAGQLPPAVAQYST